MGFEQSPLVATATRLTLILNELALVAPKVVFKEKSKNGLIKLAFYQAAFC
jgi:hypothetical protein